MTGVWFDTCLRLENTLKIMLNIYGNRKISITRELTKIYEEIIISNLEDIPNILNKRAEDNKPLKGEIVIVVNGHNPKSNLNIELLRAEIKNKLKKNSLRDVVEIMIEDTGISKKIIYNEAIKIKNNLLT